MGFVKRQMEEEDERGWRSGGERWVCAQHVEDQALEQLINEDSTSTTCSYCDRLEPQPFAIELDLLIERIATSVIHEWGNADDEGVAWDGGYVGQTYDSYDLITEALGRSASPRRPASTVSSPRMSGRSSQPGSHGR